MKKREDRWPLPATNSGPKPADFPLGSLESRAAARMMAKERAEQDAKEPLFYQAHFDEPETIYDYVTGLPVNEATAEKPAEPCTSLFNTQKDVGTETGSPPAPGEPIDDPPTPSNNHPRKRTIYLD